jgi:hypothetical protein
MGYRRALVLPQMVVALSSEDSAIMPCGQGYRINGHQMHSHWHQSQCGCDGGAGLRALVGCGHQIVTGTRASAVVMVAQDCVRWWAVVTR